VPAPKGLRDGNVSQSVIAVLRHALSQQNCSIDVETAEKGAIFSLDVVGEDLDGEVPHAHLSIEVLELALHHDVECLE